ncbi:MAG TPA: RNA 2',3'-cyclic phosphodiesterase, partial [bacterium]|nr:RNA 2',3'-cyclic phosphodiesterase [bacterium]
MRIFIAIWLSEETRKALLSAQKVLLNRFPQARAVPPDNLHLTPKFLGEVSAPEMEKVSGVLGEVASLFPPFSLTVKTAGVFPERGPVRLLWVGAEGSGLPARINRQLEGNLEKYGYPA